MGKFSLKLSESSKIQRLCKHIKREGIKATLKKIIYKIRKKIGTHEITHIYTNVYPEIDALIDFESNPGADFVAFQKNNPVDAIVKVIAFYLPQFHPFKENDEFWGKGFTEWTNVTKAKPNFIGHYQPHLPIHLGYYDLRIIDNLREQALLARNYGIEGFCFYYYWFSGKQIMTLPLENLYNHKDIDIKYCLCWANENWTRTWDGQHEGILLAQKYLENDPHQFIADVAKYFKDERYIRIDNKPVLIVYNTIEIKDFDRYINVWRTEAIKLGFEGIYIISTNACNYAEKKHEIDAMVEFPPHEYLQNIHINSTLSMINKKYSGWIYDYNNYCTQAVKKKYATKTLQSVMLGWDGTARRQHTSVIFHNFSITKFKQLISQRLYATHTNNDLSTSEKFVFINAWNEWAEGTHLEPDRKNGFAYLNAVYEEIKHFDKKYIDYLSMDKFKKHNDTAIIFHLYYLETLDDFIKKSARFHAYADFYFCIVASVFSEDLVKKIKAKIPYANIIICENRGRDILSFIRLFKKIEILNYKYVCKLHSKRSVHMDESAASRWFNDLMEQLLNCDFESVKAAIDQGSGLLIPNGYNIKIDGLWNNLSCLDGNLENIQLLAKVLDLKIDLEVFFSAGTMFWFTPKAFHSLELITSDYFNLENGAVNSDMMHAVERIFGLLCQKNNLKINVLPLAESVECSV